MYQCLPGQILKHSYMVSTWLNCGMNGTIWTRKTKSYLVHLIPIIVASHNGSNLVIRPVVCFTNKQMIDDGLQQLCPLTRVQQ